MEKLRRIDERKHGRKVAANLVADSLANLYNELGKNIGVSTEWDSNENSGGFGADLIKLFSHFGIESDWRSFTDKKSKQQKATHI